MRLVYYIFISIIFFTSCKSSFTKRHYRPGIFREHIKEINYLSLKKQYQVHFDIASKSTSKSNSNLSLSNTDSTNKYLTQVEKYELHKKFIEKSRQLEHKKEVRSKIKYKQNRTNLIPEETKDEKLRKASVGVAWAILICAILFGIGFLIGGLTGNLYVAFLIIITSGAIGIALILTFLILEILQQRVINKREKDEKIKELTNKELYRFKKNYNKLKSLNIVSTIFITIGLLSFLVMETALQTLLAWFLIIGLFISFVVLIRTIIMIREYKKYKNLLSEEEIANYKKVRNFGLTIGVLFLATVLFIALLFILV